METTPVAGIRFWTLVCTEIGMKLIKAAIIFSTALCTMMPAQAQWERVTEAPPREAHPQPGSEHSLNWFLTLSRDRIVDEAGMLCLGCKTKTGRAVGVQDYDVQLKQKALGESFGRKIIQIGMVFRVKNGWRSKRCSANRESLESMSRICFLPN